MFLPPPKQTHQEEQYKFFLWKYCGFLLALLMPLALSLVFLFRIGELSPYPEVVSRQQTQGLVYGPAISIVYYPYKLEMVRQRKPELLAMGSSRALGFHEEFFSVPFTNAAQAAVTPEQSVMFLKDVLKFYRPKVILLSLDFWWFNGKNLPDQFTVPPYNQSELTFNKLIKPYQLIAEGNLNVGDLLQVGLLGNLGNALSDYRHWGILAYKTGNGTRSDGSVFWGQYGLNDEKHYEEHFTRTLNYIRKGESHFEYGSEVSSQKMAVVKEFIALCRQNGIEVYIVVQPVANTIYQHMLARGKDYGYVRKFQQEIVGLEAPAYDYLNPETLGSNDCEFVDGYHPGDVTYLRILEKMSAYSGISRYLNLGKIRKTISAYQGHAIVPPESHQLLVKEEDFLKIGCRK